jgi:uncharacterized protein (TIGR03437 family)
MSLRGLVLAFFGFWGCATALNAQGLPGLPCQGSGTSATCAVGSSFSYDFGQTLGLTQIASLFNGIAGISFNYSFTLTGGSLPPGLTLTPSGLISGTFTQAGQFSFTLTFTENLALDTMVLFTDSVPIPLSVTVTGYSGPPVSVDPSGLSFNLTQGAAAATQSVGIANHGAQAVQFTASAATNSGGNWLSISPSQGGAGSVSSASVAVTADPSHLTPATYSGTVTISIAGGQVFVISVVAVVTSAQPNMRLSQTGLRYQAVSGGITTGPQTITVLNTGAGTLNFSGSVSTLFGGNWLSVSPSSGTSSSSAAGAVTVTVNPAGLQPGDYYGKIQFSSSNAANSPQVASVVLNVVSAANSPGAFVKPTGLIFVGSAGGTDPKAQTLTVTNPSPNALAFLVTAFDAGGGASASNWLTATPASGSVSATQPANVSVQPSLKGLAAGVYKGDLTLNIVSPNAAGSTPPQILHVEVLLLVLPSGSSSSSSLALRPSASGSCTPTQLLPVFTLLGTGFTAAVGWPTAIEVTVVDDCGKPLTAGGSVTVTFSSGDPALSLDSLNDGRWTGTWNATHSTAAVTITSQAQQVQPALTGSSSIGGALEPNTATPIVSTGGVVSAANFAANQPLAPGAFGAIFGSNLSQGLNQSTQLPLSLQLGDTSVVLAGEQLPLLFTSGQQVNVVVPYDVPVNSTQQLVVQKGMAISIPQSVVIAPALPAIFTQNGFGTGAALINVYKPDGTPLPANSPVKAGYVITLYASGLGAVNPPVAAGSAAPASPLSKTVNPVTVTIGGAPAKGLFAGLAPGFAQLYQVNVQIPSGLPSGSAVLTLSVAGQQSAPVTVTVQQ